MAGVISIHPTQIIADLSFSSDEVVKIRDVLNAYVSNVGSGVDPAAEALLAFFNKLIRDNSPKGGVTTP